MRNFSLAELMIVVAAIGITAAAAGVRDAAIRKDSIAITLGTALAMGAAVAGPPLLGLRIRRGALSLPLGLGETAWGGLGLYFLPLVAWNLLSPDDRLSAEHWLTIAGVLSGGIALAATIVGGLRALMWLVGAPRGPRRDWFAPRWTNVIGGALVLLHVALLGLMNLNVQP
jgi:hypothetical protein